jgi:hypothetical protein
LVLDLDFRKHQRVFLYNLFVLVPIDSAVLAPSRKTVPPITANLLKERIEFRAIAGNTIVVEVPSQN